MGPVPTVSLFAEYQGFVMSETMDGLKVDHKRMNRLLGILEEQIALIEEAGTPDYELIKEVIDII